MTDIDSALVKFLLVDYPAHRHKKAEQMKPLRRECLQYKKTFELHDDKEKLAPILSYKDKGEVVIQNDTNAPLEVVDIEDYIKQFPEDAKEQGLKDDQVNCKCDFIIGPTEGHPFILFVELTQSTSKNIRDSKLTHATQQLARSIQRFYEKDKFFDRYEKKVALFAYRVTDSKRLSKTVLKNMEIMLKRPTAVARQPIKKATHIIKAHGFTFEQRLYPTPYVIE